MPLRTLTRSRGMAARSLDGLRLRLPIAAQRKTALKQEVKAPDSFATTPPHSSVRVRRKRTISEARATSGFFIFSCRRVSPRFLCFQTVLTWFLPSAEAAAPPSLRFHWTVQPFSRGRVSPSGHDSPHLSRAHRSQTPLTQHAPYSLLAVTTRDASRTKAEKSTTTSANRVGTDGRANNEPKIRQTRF